MIEGIDVSDSDSGTKLVKAVQEKLGEGGTLDYVICNAGCVCVVCVRVFLCLYFTKAELQYAISLLRDGLYYWFLVLLQSFQLHVSNFWRSRLVLFL